MDKLDIKNRVKDLRIDNDLYQKDIAEYLNMSQTGYSKYETGENDIPTNILIKLSIFYNTSVDYLLGITAEKKSYKKIKTIPKLGVSEKRSRYNKGITK